MAASFAPSYGDGLAEEEEITYYVDKFRPMDKAGAYGVQEWIGFIGVENISGSYYNIMVLCSGFIRSLSRFESVISRTEINDIFLMVGCS